MFADLCRIKRNIEILDKRDTQRCVERENFWNLRAMSFRDTTQTVGVSYVARESIEFFFS